MNGFLAEICVGTRSRGVMDLLRAEGFRAWISSEVEPAFLAALEERKGAEIARTWCQSLGEANDLDSFVLGCLLRGTQREVEVRLRWGRVSTGARLHEAEATCKGGRRLPRLVLGRSVPMSPANRRILLRHLPRLVQAAVRESCRPEAESSTRWWIVSQDTRWYPPTLPQVGRAVTAADAEPRLIPVVLRHLHGDDSEVLVSRWTTGRAFETSVVSTALGFRRLRHHFPSLRWATYVDASARSSRLDLQGVALGPGVEVVEDGPPLDPLDFYSRHPRAQGVLVFGRAGVDGDQAILFAENTTGATRPGPAFPRSQFQATFLLQREGDDWQVSGVHDWPRKPDESEVEIQLRAEFRALLRERRTSLGLAFLRLVDWELLPSPFERLGRVRLQYRRPGGPIQHVWLVSKWWLDEALTDRELVALPDPWCLIGWMVAPAMLDAFEEHLQRESA